MKIKDRWSSIVKYYYAVAITDFILQIILLVSRIFIPVLQEVSWAVIWTPTLYLGIFIYVVVVVAIIDSIISKRKKK